MSAYPTPANVAAAPGVPSLAKLFNMVRGGSVVSIYQMVRVPLVSAALIALVGAIGYWLKQPWFFAGLAPTILMVAVAPGHDTTNFRAIVVGHIAAIACAYLALMIFNANVAPSMLVTRVVPMARVWASAVALAMLAIVTPQLKAWHPPAAATAVLVALGAYRMTGKTPLALIGGIVVVAIVSEALHRIPRRSR